MCWLWHGNATDAGYGKIWHEGHTLLTHRVAWELVAGSIPDGMLVCHVCDNPACCRNDDEGWYEVNGVMRPRRGHLWIGTHEDNTTDMIAKGRGPTDERHFSHLHPERVAHGEGHGNAKLTDVIVHEIRVRYASGGVSQYELAREYGISQPVVGKVIRRESWQHVM